jgi:hypothetical protein
LRSHKLEKFCIIKKIRKINFLKPSLPPSQYLFIIFKVLLSLSLQTHKPALKNQILAKEGVLHFIGIITNALHSQVNLHIYIPTKSLK